LRPDPYQSTALVTSADRPEATSARHATAAVTLDDSVPPAGARVYALSLEHNILVYSIDQTFIDHFCECVSLGSRRRQSRGECCPALEVELRIVVRSTGNRGIAGRISAYSVTKRRGDLLETDRTRGLFRGLDQVLFSTWESRCDVCRSNGELITEYNTV